MPTQRLSISKLADKLNEARDRKKKNSIYEPEVPECECELGLGCTCGRFQYDKSWPEREKRLDWADRDWPEFPTIGKDYMVSRPPDTDANYVGVQFKYWACLEGKIVHAEDTERDKNDPDITWVLFEVSKYTKKRYPDWCWIPNDGLLEVK